MQNRSSRDRTDRQIAYRRISPPTGLDPCVAGTGSSWIVYFRSSAPQDYAQALDSDLGKSERFAIELRKRGIAEPLVPLGDRRLCLATGESEIDAAIAEARRVLAALK